MKQILVLVSFLLGAAHAADAPVVTPLLLKELADIPGKEALVITVTFQPGGADPVHQHPGHAFVYVLEGEVDAWIDGDLHRMTVGDLAAFPAGTGICHCFINNGEHEALLLVGGEAPKQGSRIFYPLNPSRRMDMKSSDWWEDVPQHPLGPHDGLPDLLRGPNR
jgi:uncharacterized cupin superfamily protein